jgi:hypothetical protein
VLHSVVNEILCLCVRREAQETDNRPFASPGLQFFCYDSVTHAALETPSHGNKLKETQRET